MKNPMDITLGEYAELTLDGAMALFYAAEHAIGATLMAMLALAWFGTMPLTLPLIALGKLSRRNNWLGINRRFPSRAGAETA